MKVELVRYQHGKGHTMGLLIIDGKFYCYTLEDEYRTLKKYGSTRIPEGEYDIELKEEGGFHKRYRSRFGKKHKGMLEICDVPGFTDILIHIGNTDKDTEGCILVGKCAEVYYIQQSTDAYIEIYPVISKALMNDKKVELHIYSIGTI